MSYCGWGLLYPAKWTQLMESILKGLNIFMSWRIKMLWILYDCLWSVVATVKTELIWRKKTLIFSWLANNKSGQYVKSKTAIFTDWYVFIIIMLTGLVTFVLSSLLITECLKFSKHFNFWTSQRMINYFCFEKLRYCHLVQVQTFLRVLVILQVIKNPRQTIQFVILWLCNID